MIGVLLPLAVGLSRMYRGMHHLTDVLAGLAVGGIWLCVVTLVIVVATRQRAAPATLSRFSPDDRLRPASTGRALVRREGGAGVRRDL